MKPAIDLDDRLARIRSNLTRFKQFGRLTPREPRPETLSICGYGPSLRETWREIEGVVMTCSGSHDFLLERGTVPEFHVECDPREHKAWFVRNSHTDTIYCLASHVHPKMLARLRRNNVLLWHGYTDDRTREQVELIESLEPGARLLAGGTNVGMRAICVGLELGFRRFELFGFDCCYSGSQWAGRHSGERHHAVTILVEDRMYRTSELMLQSTDDFFNMVPMLKGCSVVVHGGLLEHRLKIYQKDRQRALSPGWWTPIGFELRAA